MKRPEIEDVLNILEYTATLNSNDITIEADWKSFNSIMKFPAEFKVNKRTQCSRDLLKELTQVS